MTVVNTFCFASLEDARLMHIGNKSVIIRINIGGGMVIECYASTKLYNNILSGRYSSNAACRIVEDEKFNGALWLEIADWSRF